MATTHPISAPLQPCLHALEAHLLTQCQAIEAWFEAEWQKTPAPVYGSVDLRNAGFKLAPIDMNLFPAGFNNLNPDFLPVAVAAAERAIHRIVPHAKNILVIPESHTRNLFYFENIATLKHILESAGFVVRLGGLMIEAKPVEVTLPSSRTLTLEPLLRVDNELQLDHFQPDFILLNNDLSEGIPAILQGIAQTMIPPAELGWSQRLKSGHFQVYAEVVEDFAKEVKVDPWLLAPLFRHCGEIDFMHQEGMSCLIADAEALFHDLQEKYNHYGITHKPFLIVKADAGTYGMAVMTVRHPDELRNMNRKQRTKMSTIKGGQPVRRVIIQEGVYSFETAGDDQSVAEPVVYLWGDRVVGGFYRVHKDRASDESLNAPGMHFEPMPFSHGCHEPCKEAAPEAVQNQFYIYGLVAKLSMLAAAREMKEQRTR